MEKRKKSIRLEAVFNEPAPENIRIPEIVIYSRENFNGVSLRTNCNIEYVGDCLNDDVYSAVVVSGEWQFYKDAGFINKLGGTLKPGYYPDLKIVDPSDLGISSIECINLNGIV